jgi:hypothetical protein
MLYVLQYVDYTNCGLVVVQCHIRHSKEKLCSLFAELRMPFCLLALTF